MTVVQTVASALVMVSLLGLAYWLGRFLEKRLPARNQVTKTAQ